MTTKRRRPDAARDGARGWDEYAPFYDWENARTVARRDIAFWTRLAAAQDGRVLELGAGTGRLAIPIARAGVDLVGVDRSDAMLARARRRARRTRLGGTLAFIRGDIRMLPFRSRAFAMVMAPYGMLQSLTRERDLRDALAAAARVLTPGGLFGIDLVPDLPRWSEYDRRVSLRGRRGHSTSITLIESVRQDRRRGLTHFDQEYVERHGRARRVTRFALTFRTLTVRQVSSRLEKSGFRVVAVLGDYQGGPWDPRADVWIILARRVAP